MGFVRVGFVRVGFVRVGFVSHLGCSLVDGDRAAPEPRVHLLSHVMGLFCVLEREHELIPAGLENLVALVLAALGARVVVVQACAKRVDRHMLAKLAQKFESPSDAIGDEGGHSRLLSWPVLRTYPLPRGSASAWRPREQRVRNSPIRAAVELIAQEGSPDRSRLLVVPDLEVVCVALESRRAPLGRILLGDDDSFELAWGRSEVESARLARVLEHVDQRVCLPKV